MSLDEEKSKSDKTEETQSENKEVLNNTLNGNGENGNKIYTEVSTGMKKSYLDYSMSVIVSRAIPSVEDGLKPVQRRILHSMNLLGLQSNKQTRKSARIVGDVLGKFHPHGDVSVYDSLSRMAQDFSLRYPLVFGQGNFGCFTKDTKVALVDGRNLDFGELITEHQKGKRNFTFTIDENQKIKIAEIKNPRLTIKNAEIMKVILDNGEEIKCTLNHKFMLKDGTYKDAKDLKSGDSLMPVYSRLSTEKDKSNCKVVEIKFLKEFEDVFDLTIDKTHNFALASGVFVHNSIDGDPQAAMRYTEAKLSNIATELLTDIDKETVKFVPNFDGSLKEPELLPGKLPNLLINGANGIAVGMATSIPPHNLSEICDGISAYVENPEISIEELTEIVKGPDFPTGGIISGDISEIYRSGRGKIILRGKVSTETSKNKERIIITEIPYLLNKSTLVTQIAELIQNKKIKDVSDLRDESSKGKIRIVLELKKGANSKFVMNSLFKYTRLQDSFNANILALVGKQPRVLNLKEILSEYVKHRQVIIRNRSNFELKKSKERLEIVEGLIIALKNIDEVIRMIKKEKNASEASNSLVKKFNLTINQAKAILETKLQQLTSMEQEKLKEENETLKKIISELEKILGDEKEILKIISKDVKELKKKYGDDRKTQVLKREIGEISEKDLVQKKEVIVMITERGYCKRMDNQTYKAQRRGGKGVMGSNLVTGDFVKQIITCSTHDYLMFFTSRGRVLFLKAYEIPEAERYSKGKSINNLIGLNGEIITDIIALRDFNDSLFMVTKKGVVKKISLKLFSKPRVTGVKGINLPNDNSDVLIDSQRIKENEEVLIATRKGRAIRFNSKDVRSMGRASYGVTGIRLDRDDEVVSSEILNTQEVLTITRNGFGKRTSVQDYRKTARGGKGVINLKISEKTGEVVTTISVNEKDNIVITTAKGMVVRTNLENIRIMGRAAQGVRIVRLQEGDYVTDLIRIQEGE